MELKDKNIFRLEYDYYGGPFDRPTVVGLVAVDIIAPNTLRGMYISYDKNLREGQKFTMKGFVEFLNAQGWHAEEVHITPCDVTY